MSNQSSVEWLENEFASLYFDYLTGLIDNKEYNERHKVIMKQAKAMHKEEVLSFNTLLDKHEMEALNNNTILLTKEEFYNETFVGNND